MLNLMTRTSASGLSSHVVSEHSAHTAPKTWRQGTAVPAARTRCAGAVVDLTLIAGPVSTVLSAAVPAFASVSAQVAFGARVADLPGSPPRGAPV